MSGEREALMVAAGDEITISEPARRGKTKDVTYKLRPVRVRELLELERASLKVYKREYLQTFRDNLDLLDDTQEAKTQLITKMDQVGKWGLDDLPQKNAYAVNYVAVTDSLRSWVESQYGILPETELGVKAVILNALDSGVITSEKVHELTDTYPMRGQVRYDQWWVTGSLEGMIAFVFASVKQCHTEMTPQHIEEKWPYVKIVEASRLVEDLTAASVGNG